MNTDPQPVSQIDFPTRPLRPAELAHGQQSGVSWLWHGYLAAQKVTALVSAPKTGKTTLLSILLARFSQGEQPAGLQLAGGQPAGGQPAGVQLADSQLADSQLAGLPVKPARVVVVSEESAADWDDRCRRLGIGQNVQFLCRPFKGARPTDAQWLALIANLETLQRREGFDLVVIDALAALLPGYAESCAPKLLDCLLPLQAVANLGPAVWLLHHPAKGKSIDGQSSRGTLALPGFADIVMEMSCCRRARSRDRRRRICGYSRYAETPRHLIVELDAAGGDYLVRTDAHGTPLVRLWPRLEEILTSACRKFSQQELLDRWPADDDRPDRSTLSRWLKRATAQGVIMCEGGGRRGDGFVYWLPGREPDLWPGDNASQEEQDAWRARRRAQDEARRLQQRASA